MSDAPANPTVHPWREVDIALRGAASPANPYTDVEVWADFVHESGHVLRRPGFWDGGRVWRLRFAPPTTGRWRWRTGATGDAGLDGVSGEIEVVESPPAGHDFYDHGFWRMSPHGRNLVHADGTSAILVADTAWALPWRATAEQVEVYAADRARKGFNTAFLMAVQPDMDARGPRDRTQDEGFDVGFEDLADGHLNALNVDYFRYLDTLLAILVAHGLVPAFAPVFQGFGWKGLRVAGTVVPPAECARFCRYLVARYGARPAVWLVGSDGGGDDPQVEAAGREIQEWDGYGQPTGIHYQPHGANDHFQDAEWLDFQSCQTGHESEHAQARVADMWRNRPVKAVMNGEPTYEHSGLRGRGEGWWQGHEAWSNLCAGGTFGVVYGAASLWQWRLHADEPGHQPYFLAEGAGWREALDFEGSTYVGLVSKILRGLPTTDMEPNWVYAICMRALAVPDVFYLGYRESGGLLSIRDKAIPRAYRLVDPRDGRVLAEGVRDESVPTVVEAAAGEPVLYLFADTWPESSPR